MIGAAVAVWLGGGAFIALAMAAWITGRALLEARRERHKPRRYRPVQA